MGEVLISLLAELNDFLPQSKRGSLLSFTMKSQTSIKHVVESLGIPHTEIGQIIINEVSVTANYIVRSGDFAAVYPFSPEHDQISKLFNEDKLSLEPQFILDNHLGKLATYLRIFGFDSLYDNDFQDTELAILAEQEKRILITRDRQLLMRKQIHWGYWVRSKYPEEQLREVIRKFRLLDLVTPFHRCLKCNTKLQRIQKEDIFERLEPLTQKYFEEFHICPGCDQIYWKGSHYERMQRLIERVALS
jgi:uncharacterized protein with PIN domain